MTEAMPLGQTPRFLLSEGLREALPSARHNALRSSVYLLIDRHGAGSSTTLNKDCEA